MSGMSAELPVVEIKLSRSGAVVLFDWLSADLNTVPTTHPPQEQAPLRHRASGVTNGMSSISARRGGVRCARRWKLLRYRWSSVPGRR